MSNINHLRNKLTIVYVNKNGGRESADSDIMKRFVNYVDYLNAQRVKDKMKKYTNTEAMELLLDDFLEKRGF